MDILIISEFCGDFSSTDNDRFLYLAKKLADNHEVEIVTSSFQHTTKKQRESFIKELSTGIKVTYIREPGYPKNICIERFSSHRAWGKKLIAYVKQRKTPDVIYCAIPSLTGPNLVAKYCEKNGIRFVIDVQDLWPEAFQMVVNIPVISKMIFAPFKHLANSIYKKADAICAVSDTYCERAISVNHKCKNTTTVYLGTELATFDKFALEEPIIDKQKDVVWLGYCGTLGSSYDITCVIDALALLKNESLSFIVMGDGPRKEEFERYAVKKGVNAIFTGRLAYNKMCSLLSICDITVNPIAHGAAQSIINKHADYAASGLPVLNTQECLEYKKMINKYNMGFNCDNNNAKDLANKISELLKNKKMRIEMGHNSRKCAEELFDRDKNYIRLVKEIESL